MPQSADASPGRVILKAIPSATAGTRFALHVRFGVSACTNQALGFLHLLCARASSKLVLCLRRVVGRTGTRALTKLHVHTHTKAHMHTESPSSRAFEHARRIDLVRTRSLCMMAERFGIGNLATAPDLDAGAGACPLFPQPRLFVAMRG